MDGKQWLPAGIVDALEIGATVVTGNQRAARTLRRGFDRRNRELGLKSWQPPEVMAWESWAAGLWHRLLVEGHATQLVLNRAQEHAVWRTVLEADDELASLRTVDSLAEMAAEAWRLVCSYGGRQRLRGAMGGSSDTRSFQRWAGMFERLCRTENFVSQSQLEEMLRGYVEAGVVVLPASGVVLVGFDAMTPAQRGLVEALRAAGVRVSELQFEVDASARLLVSVNDEREELSAAARWVRRFLEQQPGARVAVIVPGLEAERPEIDRIFRETLAPELQDIRAGNENAPYEFSVGRALADLPMVATALNLLRWAAEPLPLERVSALLLSPYFAMTSEERGPRAEFDAFELRRARMLRPEITLEGLLGAVEGSKRKSTMQRLLAALRWMNIVVRRLQGMDARSHAEWAERIREVLEAAAWEAGPHESSVEFQMRRKWESALDELATLDFDGARVEFAQALDALEGIARQTMFAPESREAPVQIMGPLEAAGSTFDAVWFLRCGELSWPMQTGSNPLLPWQMQRELGMPGIDIERDREHACRITQRIANCAGTVIFSYARESDEGRQRLSPALSGLHLEEIDARQLAGDAEERTVVALEEIEDAARVRELPDQVIRGGARILELQAACGFRAFAEQRLWATELDSIEPGLDARESGTVVHKVLEIFWNEVKTQEALKSMTTDEREEVLDWCIAEGLKRTEASSATAWDIAYMEMQRERLRRLLRGWLELEIERALPFEVKLSEKEFKDVKVGPLRLSVRMDRVDIVEGGEVLIDYKTGPASPSDWLTERPDAPQLPLYSILSNASQLQGVAFGLVRAGEGRALKGYAAEEGVLPRAARLKEAATLEAQVDRWRQVLTALAEEFHQGDARVRPKTYPGTCGRCGQRLLCRLDVTTLQGNDEEDGHVEVSRG
jgi:ATP-dependent helicase/nuclease subunit B